MTLPEFRVRALLLIHSHELCGVLWIFVLGVCCSLVDICMPNCQCHRMNQVVYLLAVIRLDLCFG